MTTRERQEIYFHGSTDGAALCANCKHFYPHYLNTGVYGYRPANSGHCCYPRLKLRRAYDTCEKFERRE